MTEDTSRVGIPRAFVVFAVLWIAASLAYAAFTSFQWPLFMAEDGIMEWFTACCYVAAGAIGLRRAIRTRSVFDGLVALFCLFVAGEEISWGQRLVGLTPPEVFLKHNRQQELTLHNFVQPKTVFLLIVFAYGVAMPLAWRTGKLRALMNRIGATAPPMALVPWTLVTLVLAYWNPHKALEEWTEALAAVIFLTAMWRPGHGRMWRWTVAAVAGGSVALALISARGSSLEDDVRACAAVEVRTLARDLTRGNITSPALRTGMHVRQIWIAAKRGDIQLDKAVTYHTTPCTGRMTATTTTYRRSYAVDPWGLSYWVAARDSAGLREVIVYSFGPNRRLDGKPWAHEGDDIVSAPQ